MGIFFITGSIILIWFVGITSNKASIAFFCAGGLLLIGGLFLFRARLARHVKSVSSITKISQLYYRNLARRAGRGLVTVGSMAVGAFLVVSTGAFRKSPESSPYDYKSGTGGFSFWGRISLSNL